MHDNLIILAGGMSSRMKKPATSNKVSVEDENEANIKNKSLISVGHEGRPLMDYLLYNAKNVGYKNIYIVINEKGDFDFSVVIRSITYNSKNNYLSFMVGGAITNQSDPEKEYEECLLKAKAMLEVLSD